MFMMNNSSCPETEAIVNVHGFEVMLATEAVLALVALIPNALMIMTLARTRVFHINLRLLLAHLNVILLFYSGAILSKSMLVLTSLTSGDVCSLAMKLYECKLREFPAAFPNNALSYGSFAICLERVYCTIRYRQYDKNGARPWLGMVFILIIWIIVLTNQIVNLEATSRTVVTPICENMLSVTPSAGVNTLIPQIALEISIVLISLGVYLYNKHQLNSAFLNRSRMTLSARFQMDQNVQLNRIVTPTFIFEAVCYVPIMLLLIMVARGYETTISIKVLLTHFSYIWKLAFCCLQPVLSFYKNPHLNKGLKKIYDQMIFVVLKKSKVAPIEHKEKKEEGRNSISSALKNQELYFRNLEELWSVQEGKRGKWGVCCGK